MYECDRKLIQSLQARFSPATSSFNDDIRAFIAKSRRLTYKITP
jgi:hypothetical protein